MRRHQGLLTDHSRSILAGLGQNVDLARTRRRLTVEIVCSRAGITPQTYRRLVAGEPGITMGVLIGILTALDLEDSLAGVASPGTDEVGIFLERASRPKRVRATRNKNELDTDF